MPGLLVPRRCRAPGRLHGNANTQVGGPFATLARDLTRPPNSISRLQSNPLGNANVFARECRRETSPLRGSLKLEAAPVSNWEGRARHSVARRPQTQKNTHASQSRHLHLARLTLSRPWSPTGSHRAKHRHCSAGALGQTRQLADRSIPLPRTAAKIPPIALVPFRRTETVETGKQLVRSHKTRAEAPKAARLRPAKLPTLVVSTASFRFTAFRETGRPHSQNHGGRTIRQHASSGASGHAHVPSCRRPRSPLSCRFVRTDCFALSRLRRGKRDQRENFKLLCSSDGMKDRSRFRLASLMVAVRKDLAFLGLPQEQLYYVPPRCRIPLTREPSALGSPPLHRKCLATFSGPVH